MSYKQSLAYSKNLIKETKIEVLKKKPIMPFTGIATVKLYDSLTGKQTYEAKSENRISAVFGNIAYLDGFYYPILDNMKEILLKDIFTTYPFRIMVLTTGDIPEDVYDYFTWGSIVGYADAWYTYSGCIDTSGASAKYKSCIARYNKDGTFFDKVEVYTGSSGFINITKIPNNKFYSIIQYNTAVELNNDLTLYGAGGFTSSSYDSVVWDNDTSTLFTYSSTTYGELKQQYIVPASAHTLLPEAITKTPTNTMKIQYDFTCDYVYPLDMPAH